MAKLAQRGASGIGASPMWRCGPKDSINPDAPVRSNVAMETELDCNYWQLVSWLSAPPSMPVAFLYIITFPSRSSIAELIGSILKWGDRGRGGRIASIHFHPMPCWAVVGFWSFLRNAFSAFTSCLNRRLLNKAMLPLRLFTMLTCFWREQKFNEEILRKRTWCVLSGEC